MVTESKQISLLVQSEPEKLMLSRFYWLLWRLRGCKLVMAKAISIFGKTPQPKDRS